MPAGTIVALEGDKIRPAEKGDNLFGVISETAGVVLGEASLHWSGRYVKNEFGGYVYELQPGPDGEKVMALKKIRITALTKNTSQETIAMNGMWSALPDRCISDVAKQSRQTV
ncbi:peptidase G2 autoproteolytic cleavage domain-containing protein [Bacillus sp. JJ675]